MNHSSTCQIPGFAKYGASLPGISSIACPTSLRCVAVGAAVQGQFSSIITTSDGAMSWNPPVDFTSQAVYQRPTDQNTFSTVFPFRGPPTADLNHVVCPTSKKCWAVGGASSGAGGAILFSGDAGNTWSEQYTTPFPYTSVYDPNNLIASQGGGSQSPKSALNNPSNIIPSIAPS